MSMRQQSPSGLDPATRSFYCEALEILNASGAPYLVGGAYAFDRYTGIERHTKDLDIFMRAEHVQQTLDRFAARGWPTERSFPHWLAKAYHGDDFVDIIYSSGNGVAPVDDEWFQHAVDDEVLGVSVKLVPPEEMIWQKAFVMERERFDGADVAHLLLVSGRQLDWRRLLRRFGERWRVLLAHLVLFGFVYPAARDRIPAWVTAQLLGRLEREVAAPPDGERVCQGTLLSRSQYLVDVERWGFADPRLGPDGPMSARDVERWTTDAEREHAVEDELEDALRAEAAEQAS